MTQTVKQVSNEVYDVLKQCKVEEGHLIVLPPIKLDRKLYEAVNKALDAMGGKWDRKAKAHVFPVDPTEKLRAILETGNAPAKNPTDFFATPTHIADRMAACISGGYVNTGILEPSAGTGAIAQAIRKHCQRYSIQGELDCCEILPEFQAHLRGLGLYLAGRDFLEYFPLGSYDYIFMNPPFTSEHDPLAYIAHIERAWQFLAPDGLLMAIAPGGFAFRNDRRIQRFRSLVEKHGSWEQLEEGAFKDSGTGVRTVLIEMRKG